MANILFLFFINNLLDRFPLLRVINLNARSRFLRNYRMIFRVEFLASDVRNSEPIYQDTCAHTNAISDPVDLFSLSLRNFKHSAFTMFNA